MRRWVEGVGLAIAFLLLVSQFIPVNRSNPVINSAMTIYGTQPVPADVKAVFERSCKNCHSNATSWPWYSYVAPVSWIVAHDVHQARKAMNLSEWGSYAPQRKEDKLEAICEQLTNGDMPDPKYVIFHRNAQLTAGERTAVCQWTDDARQY